MKNKILWLVVSCLVVLSLVLASCGPAAVEEEKGKIITGKVEEEQEKEVATEKEKEVAPEVEMVQDSLGRLVEKPRYGGVLNMLTLEVEGFDEAYQRTYKCLSMQLTNDELFTGDWTRGLSGTGENPYAVLAYFDPDFEVGCLAESWEYPDAETIIYHIRKGVHFHDKPPTSGREMTADDVVFSMMRALERKTGALAGTFTPEGTPLSITAPDKWTVVIKVNPGYLGRVVNYTTEYIHVIPREVIEKYGDMNDWRVSCGTGPFMLVDYIHGSSATFERNPNYWGKHPFHPEDTLPYVDGAKYLIIPDESTQSAALRTGKLDYDSVRAEELPTITSSNPELHQVKLHLTYPQTMWMRTDTEPFDDIKVRRALSMAIDREKMKEDYFSGDAYILGYPIAPEKEFAALYTPLEEQSQSVQELYEYNPDKAKQLLAEAGYPDGFKTEIVCLKTDVDMLSMVKAYFADIGVDMELTVKEMGAWYGMLVGKRYQQMIISWSFNLSPGDFIFRTGYLYNAALLSDPVVDQAFKDYSENQVLNEPEAHKILRDIYPYILDLALVVETPSPDSYLLWQPWLKGYNGEWSVGYRNRYQWAKYVWVDQDLKEEMTGKR